MCNVTATSSVLSLKASIRFGFTPGTKQQTDKNSRCSGFINFTSVKLSPNSFRISLEKLRSLSLCTLVNCNLFFFLCCFWSKGFFLAEWPFSPYVDNDTLISFSQHLHVFCYCSGVDMHISHQSTFTTSVWWLDIPMVFMLVYNCLNRWMWRLQASGNCTQG